ncbi:hypothetical protein LUZ63_015362 [Rhynchospora breviuscula]|uniref:Uncharacterized protein n=1 Tax=Rhynchospora breviuscula TaxID=2022672 RepID=A0A9Q0CCF1_9POAL|nr:hypothetical protein LUZ63_015362 [Rhynchospora breviuscula]
MSVVGFDVGNDTFTVAVARQRGIDVILNDESKRETPSVISFAEKQRSVGAASLTNPKNSVSQIKRLLGRKFSDPQLQTDLQTLPFKVTEGPDGLPLVHVSYLGEERRFTPTQLFAMVLSNMKGLAEKNFKGAVVDCCIGIPVYFTDLQRRAVLDAATIAGLRPLRLFHETTATALAYGIYKTDLSETDPTNVAFVDIGHASMQVCIVAFKKGQLKILSHSYDTSLGGRDFDEVLFRHFASKFKSEYKIDVLQNARASTRLRTACEKLKKMLSANSEAPMGIECLMDDKDVKGFMKRDEFEKLSAPILDRILDPLKNAVAEAGLTQERIHSVEVVGSGSRIPAIIKILTTFFGREPRRTMNASECVARGCALQCAILSPTFRVRDFQIQESFPFSINLTCKEIVPDAENSGTESEQCLILFPKGNVIPSTKVVTLSKSGTFTLDAVYAEGSTKLCTYTIGPFQTSNGERAKVHVSVCLNLHGVVSIDSAILLEEVAEVPVSAEQDTTADMDTDEVPNKSNELDCDTSMPESSDDHSSSSSPCSENGAPISEKKLTETDKVTEVNKTTIPVSELVHGGMTSENLQKAMEQELEMALQDRIVEETKEKKNAVEAYIYDMRNKLSDKYLEFVVDKEREDIVAKLQETEDWLYEEGEDETKGVYISKLDELKKGGDPIEERHREWSERGTTIQLLYHCIHSFRNAAMSTDSRFDHIDQAEKQKVIKECIEADRWIREMRQHQDALPKHATPILFSADIRKKAEILDRFCKPIMTRPKPPPPKQQTPPPTEELPQQAEHPPVQEPVATDKPEGPANTAS